MNFITRVRLRALLHGAKLVIAGITGNIDTISKYIPVAGKTDILNVYHFGNEYKGKVFFVINEAGEGNGFFAEFKLLLDYLIYSDKSGFIPCVRYGKKYLYFDEDVVETDNPYEYYFEPIGKDIDLNSACNIVTCNQTIGYGVEYGNEKYNDMYHINEDLANEMAEVIRKYVVIKKEIKNELDEFYYNTIRKDSDRVLGVHYRGTDFKAGYKNHPTNVTLGQLKQAIEECLSSNNFDKVFLATDDGQAYDELKNVFGEKIVGCDDVVRSYDKVSVAFSNNSRPLHHYKLGKEVLKDMYLLSMCDGLICGLSQVSSVAHLFKMSRGKEYEYYKVIDNGINSSGKLFANTVK